MRPHHNSQAKNNSDHAGTIAHARRVADLLDQRFTIPGTNIKYGYDALLGLLPVVGDSITLLIGLYILLLAKRTGARKRTQLRMAWNLTIDWLIGLIPILDIVFDVAYKANVRNANLLTRDLEQR